MSDLLKDIADQDFSFDIKLSRFVQSFYKETQIIFDYQAIINLILDPKRGKQWDFFMNIS